MFMSSLYKLSRAAGITATMCAFGLQMAACSSSSSDSSGADAAADAAPVIPKATCVDGGLRVAYDPMYSAYVTDVPHTFQIPALVSGSNGTVTWSADSAYVGMQQSIEDMRKNEVLITVLKPGNVVINVQSSDGKCGSSVLEITAAKQADWLIGKARYNDGVSLHLQGGTPTQTGSPLEEGSPPACTNCHGQTATQGPFTNVSHTPEQTGGFSNDDLVNIITKGEFPDAGNAFDPKIVSYSAWQNFHRWTDITPDQQLGIIVYLRSLLPDDQKGSINFGFYGDDDSGSADDETDAASDSGEMDAESVGMDAGDSSVVDGGVGDSSGDAGVKD
jgi:hypothetical protein